MVPELPEIEAAVRIIRPRVTGSRLSNLYVRQPKAANLPLEEMRERCRQKVEDMQRRAKYAVFQMPAGALWLHLGLTAEVAFLDDNENLEDCALGFEFDNGVSLGLRSTFMGRVDYLETEESRKRWGEFGPEPLDASFALDTVRVLTSKKPKQTVKALLMDQALIAGIGNVYSDEILYAARIHPLRKAGALSEHEIKRLFESAKSVLDTAVQHGGEMKWPGLDASLGRYESQVHGRETCRPFGHQLEKIKIGSRTAYYCPVEQKL